MSAKVTTSWPSQLVISNLRPTQPRLAYITAAFAVSISWTCLVRAATLCRLFCRTAGHKSVGFAFEMKFYV